MIFIGVISKYPEFEVLRKNIRSCKNKNEITLININKKSIENLKNVKFDTIVLLDSLEELKDKNNNLQKMCTNLKYLIINSDIEIRTNTFSHIKANVITYGLNHISTVTFSSIADETMLISVQRAFENYNKKNIEVGEYDVKVQKEERINLYEILLDFIIEKLYF